jgi:5S rRNA maturation endonuclease (ribonuclease M5)
MNKALLSLLARTGLISADDVDRAAEGDQLVRCVCPLHDDADNPTAFALKTDYWICNTRHCEKDYGARLEGLVVALADRYGGGRLRFRDARRWLQRNASRLQEEVFSDWQSTKGHRGPSSGWRNTMFPCSREWVLQNLSVPSWYFRSRGFDLATLRRYDIGDSRQGRLFPGSTTWAVVPLYDLDDPNRCVGYVARNPYGSGQFRWKFSAGFPAAHQLFHYGLALQANKDTGRLLVVEGAPDALRCVEAGFPDVVALLGNKILPQQVERLAKLRLDEVVLLADNDQGGDGLTRDATKNLSSLAKSVRRVRPPDHVKDIGDLPTAEAREFLMAQLSFANRHPQGA